MKNELSKRNKYWIPKYRYLELKNWTRQYYDWERALRETAYVKSPTANEIRSKQPSKPVESIVEYQERAAKSIRLLITTIDDIFGKDSNVGSAFFMAVTEGRSYDQMYAFTSGNLGISRDDWYAAYRRFFYILDKRRE